jgi:hypothetical protein
MSPLSEVAQAMCSAGYVVRAERGKVDDRLAHGKGMGAVSTSVVMEALVDETDAATAALDCRQHLPILTEPCSVQPSQLERAVTGMAFDEC